jgi:hypothetical protein
VGMWHSHPFGDARPSPTDKSAMSALVTPVAGGPNRALVLIVAGRESIWRSWVDGGATPAVFARFVTRATHGDVSSPPPVPARHKTEALRGGWTDRVSVVAVRRRRRWFRKRRKTPLS